MVINMVTDIKQTCLEQGLGVTFTARKRPSKFMFAMKDLGHTLPDRQNLTFESNSRCYYLKKSHANHSVKQLSKFAKLDCLYKLLYKRAFFQVVVWVMRHKINPFNIKGVMLDIPEPSMLDLRMQTCAGSSESLSHVVSTKIWNYVRRQFNFNRASSHELHACADPEYFVRGGSESKNGPPSAHQQNAYEMAFCWHVNGPLLNAGLVAVWFLGDPDQYC